MAITTISGIRQGGFARSAAGTELTETWVFRFDAGETAFQVFAASSFPQIGTKYPGSSWLFLRSISCSGAIDSDQRSGIYEFTLTYASAENPGLASPSVIEPWDMPPYNVRAYPVDKAVPFTKAYTTGDLQGAPSVHVHNAAGDSWEIVTNKPELVLAFSYNLPYASFNLTYPAAYYDTINSGAVTVLGVSIGANQGLIRNLQPVLREQYTDTGALDYQYWQVDAEIQIARAGEVQGDLVLRQNGYYAYATASTPATKYRIFLASDGNTRGKEEALDADAMPIDVPADLAANGTLLAHGATPIYATWHEKFSTSWTSLNFPTSMV